MAWSSPPAGARQLPRRSRPTEDGELQKRLLPAHNDGASMLVRRQRAKSFLPAIDDSPWSARRGSRTPSLSTDPISPVGNQPCCNPPPGMVCRSPYPGIRPGPLTKISPISPAGSKSPVGLARASPAVQSSPLSQPCASREVRGWRQSRRPRLFRTLRGSGTPGWPQAQFAREGEDGRSRMLGNGGYVSASAFRLDRSSSSTACKNVGRAEPCGSQFADPFGRVVRVAPHRNLYALTEQ